MADYVEPSRLYHFYCGCEECLDHVADVVMEIIMKTPAESLITTVTVDKTSVAGGHEVHRAYHIVERQLLNERVRRTKLTSKIIHLHRGVEFHTVAVCGPDSLHFREVAAHFVGVHVAGRLDGDGTVGRETVVGEAAAHRLSRKRLHGGAPVAELGVRVEVIQLRSVRLFQEVHWREVW